MAPSGEATGTGMTQMLPLVRTPSTSKRMTLMRRARSCAERVISQFYQDSPHHIHSSWSFVLVLSGTVQPPPRFTAAGFLPGAGNPAFQFCDSRIPTKALAFPRGLY
jgi:hypothetical protein